MNSIEGFASQLLVSFLLDIVGNSRQGLRAEPGYHPCPCSWNSWIHHLFRGGGGALSWKWRLQISAYGFHAPPPTRLPGVNKHFEIIGGWAGENVKQRLWFVVLKTLESFLILLVPNNEAENRVRKGLFLLLPGHMCWPQRAFLVTRKRDDSTSLGGWDEGGHCEERGTRARVAAEGGRHRLAL